MLPIYIRRRQPAAADQIDGNTMAKVLQRVEITLRSFYIFNSSFCQKEGEEEKKVLFYHPVDIELNTKIRDVGLSEAIITFTGTFTNEDDCKALHTQKTTQLFHQPEPGYWLVMVLNVPKEFRLKEGIEVADYRGVEVSDRIYHAVLRQCYHMYRFHYGLLQTKLTASPSTAASEEQRQFLAAELQQFYARYLSSSKELKHCDIMDMLHSIQYLALDKTLFLRAHNFNMLCDTFPVIKECIMLYNEQVVCGGKLNASDLYSLHSHILAMSSADNSNAEKYRQGAFVSGEEETPIKVYLDVDGNIESHYLLVYRALSLTLCLFVDAKLAAPQPEFYEELNNYLGPQLSCLSRDISTEISKQNVSTTLHDNNSNDSAPKYLFINEQSLKHHTNIYRNAKSIPRNVMSIIADLANPINDTNAAGNAAATEELQVKTTNDYWIVKRRCNWRQYYVILCKSKATLLDVTQEAKRIFEQELTDDVFFDK